jgi:tetratricopeptide (TPR) repeat protein
MGCSSSTPGGISSGVTLAEFKELADEALRLQPLEGPLRWDGTRRKAGEALTTADVCTEIVKARTHELECAYIDIVPAAKKGRATIYTSHAWGYVFTDVFDALEQVAGRHDFIWFCMLANNQHKTGDYTYAFLKHEFISNVRAAGRTVLVFAPWDKPLTLTSVWCCARALRSSTAHPCKVLSRLSAPEPPHALPHRCLFEIFVCVRENIAFEVAMPAKQQQAFERALVEQFDSIASSLSSIDLADAQATKPVDKANIMQAVEADIGVHELNKSVQGVLREWLAGAGRKALAAKPNDWSLMDALGRLLQQQGKLPEAEQLLRRAFEGREQLFGARHLDTLGSAHNLGLVLRGQGRLAEAELLVRHALEGREQLLGASHEHTLESVSKLGTVLLAQRSLEGAEQLFRRALEGEQTQLGVRHLGTLATVNSLATVLKDQGKLPEAERLYRRALEGREQQLSASHPDMLLSVSGLGLVLQAQGKLAEAEQLLRRTLQGREAQLGASHPHTLSAVHNLAGLFHAKGKLAEAEQLYRRALEGREQQLGAIHRYTLASLGRLAAVLRDDADRLDEAIPLLHRHLERLVEANGMQHPEAIGAARTLFETLEESGRSAEAQQLRRRFGV